MEITCPNCQHTFEAATRRSICQSCSTELDVWALLAGQTSISHEPKEPYRIVNSTEGVSFRTRSTPAEDSPDAIDRYATSFAPSSESVLDLPLEPMLVAPSRESDPILEESFSALPPGLVQPVAEEGVVTVTGVHGDGAGESALSTPDEVRPSRRLAGWFLAAALTIGVVAPLIYFLRDAMRPVDASGIEVTTPARSSALPSGSPVVPVTSPVVVTTSPAAQPAEAIAESTSRKPTPSPAVETRQSAESRTPAVEDSQGDSATRARAVNPEILSVGRYTLQVGAHPTEDEAKRMAERLIDAGLDARIMRVAPKGLDPFYRVRVGAFATKEEAAAYGEQLKGAGRIATFYVTDRHR